MRQNQHVQWPAERKVKAWTWTVLQKLVMWVLGLEWHISCWLLHSIEELYLWTAPGKYQWWDIWTVYFRAFQRHISEKCKSEIGTFFTRWRHKSNQHEGHGCTWQHWLRDVFNSFAQSKHEFCWKYIPHNKRNVTRWCLELEHYQRKLWRILETCQGDTTLNTTWNNQQNHWIYAKPHGNDS